MKIAVLSWYAPGRRDSGERVRLAGVVEELSRAHQVDCLFLEPGTHDDNAPDGWLELRSTLKSPPYRVPRRSVIRATILGRSVYGELLGRRRIAGPIREWLTAQQYDVIVANQLYVMPLIPTAMHGQVILDTHNADSTRLKRLAGKGQAGMLRRGPAHLQYILTRRLELQLAKTLMGVWAVSDVDAKHFRSLSFKRVSIVPNGTQVPPRERQAAMVVGSEIELLFVGSLGYSANLDALRWFCDNWSATAHDVSWRLTVVGSGDISRARHIVAKQSNITLVGGVESVDDYYFMADALVLPMRQGGGTRLKVIEALAVRLPIISTEMGMEGVGAQPWEHYLLARSSEEFNDALKMIRDSSQDVRRITERGLRLGSQFLWPVIGKAMESSLMEWTSSKVKSPFVTQTPNKAEYIARHFGSRAQPGKGPPRINRS